MKRSITLGLMFIGGISVWADANWRMHPTFDELVGRVVETPEYTYFTSRTLPVLSSRDDYKSLFRYDKDGDELRVLSTDNYLSFNTVLDIQYSPAKGYLMVLYGNYDIDFLYDNGDVVNMPAYRMANLNYSKNVNGITIDEANDRIYLATDFGYVALNDAKHEIAESRVYGEPFSSVARIGDKIVALHGNDIIAAPVSDPRMSLSDYSLVSTVSKPYLLASLGSGVCLLGSASGSQQQISSITLNNDVFEITPLVKDKFLNVEYNKNGVIMAASGNLYQFTPDGKWSAVPLPEEDAGLCAGSYDLSEIWHGAARKGLKSGRPGTGGTWTVTRDYMLPDAPAPFISTEMAVHPSRGLLAVNYGFDYNFGNSFPHSSPVLLSAYRDGHWSCLSPAYTYPEQTDMMRSPNGFAIDPDNPDLVYLTSAYSGIARINLADGSDVIHLSRPSDRGKDLPGFVEFVPDQTGPNNWGCQFTAPKFDADGNLWTMYVDMDNQTPQRLHIYCWLAADRRATTSARNLVPPKKVEIEGYKPQNIDDLLPLKASSNRNLLFYTTRQFDSPLMLIDTNGTPLDTSDDKIKFISNASIKDQDEMTFKPTHIRCMWEDPNTGNVWVGHDGGVFYFNPRRMIDGDDSVSRIKVARNDGTQLADYLLDGASVNKIAVDGSGRKWFATFAGVVCTSSDGRTIEHEFNASNSPLPDNSVYCLQYVPAHNSMMISTAQGYAEYFISGSSSGSDSEPVKIYPNPVRPDYLGYVTIEGAPSDGIVKIVDASGNIVKELGRANGSEVKWDVTNHQFKRVSSGVYYVLVSSGSSDSEFSNVGKVLVVN